MCRKLEALEALLLLGTIFRLISIRKKLLAERFCASKRILTQRFGNEISLSSLCLFFCLTFVPLISYLHKGLKTETFVPMEYSRRLKHYVLRHMVHKKLVPLRGYWHKGLRNSLSLKYIYPFSSL